MRSALLALAFAVGVSSTPAQETAAVARKTRSSRVPSAESYLDRGNGWLKKGEFARAIADYSIAIEFDGAYEDAYYNRGMAQVGKRDLEGAIRDFDQAISLNPRQ